MTLQHQNHPEIDQTGTGQRLGTVDEEEEDLAAFFAKLEREVRDHRSNLPDPIDTLKKVMERRGLSNRDLKPYIGSSGNVCDILKRRRHLSLAMIRRLHSGLGIPASILIQEYPRRRS